MIQTMEDIIRRFCAYGVEYKDHEGYTHDCVTLLPEVQLAYNTSQHSTTGKSPSLVEKGWNSLFHLLDAQVRKKITTSRGGTNPTWNLTLRKGRRALHYHQPDRENEVEVKLTEEVSRKHPVFPVSLVKPYIQTEEDTFPCRKKSPTPPEIVEVENTPGAVKKLINARKIRLNGKEQKQYLVRFKNKTADKDKCLEEEAIPDGNICLRQFWASRRTEKSHK
ncbi:hypothetical protein O181_035823 [Austropuccinia psidii MF-1]|uniref:Uncharacterized protein n=1 Tax=Austropuccinia psidii MF-1 TaxID=1389203 RepID=A0A9Q3D893_9BASI|nr:hypothetical protein [Austropuccinia psidii MF-1]